MISTYWNCHYHLTAHWQESLKLITGSDNIKITVLLFSIIFLYTGISKIYYPGNSFPSVKTEFFFLTKIFQMVKHNPAKLSSDKLSLSQTM